MKQFLSATVKTLDPDDPVGSFEAVISAPTLDRDGEVIARGAFNPLPADIPIHVDHAMNIENLVARAVPYYEGDLLKVRGRFTSTPKAQMVRGLVIDGTVSTMSVGFMGAKREHRNEATVITKGELLEASFVSIPSNREARVLVARNWDERRSAKATATEAATAVARLDLELAEIVLRTMSDRPRRKSATADEANALLRRLLRS